MNKNGLPFWYDDAAQFLDEHASEVTAKEVVIQVRAGTTRWTVPLPEGRDLWLLRLSNPVVERDEVFLGNVLFNDWLNKSLKPAVEGAGLGIVHPLTNNLDTAYFLVVTDATLEAIAEAYRMYLLGILPDLFFGDEDSERGIHGNLRNMFTFTRSDLEPFPIFAVPLELAEELERRVRNILSELIQRPYLKIDAKKGTRKPTDDLRSLGAVMAFFYGRTSGSTGDCQSYRTFIARMATEYNLLKPVNLREAFRLSTTDCPDNAEQRVYKEALDKSIKDGTFDEAKIRTLLRRILGELTSAIDNEAPDTPIKQSWLIPYLREKEKLVNLSCNEYLKALLHRVIMGEHTLALNPVTGERCRVCGDQAAVVEEKNILLGVSVKRFHNQRPNQSKGHSRRLCVRCALYTYLDVKQLGSTSVGKYPVPNKGNLIFHYGPHSPKEVEALGRRVNALVKAIRRKNRLRAEYLGSIKKQAKEKRQAWSVEEERQALIDSLMEQEEQGEVNAEDLARLQVLTEKMSPVVDQTLSNAGSAYVLDIGLGDWRLMAFAVEHLKDQDELAQRRFAHGRLLVFTLMSFLQETCGCHGPYYFQSPPRLAADRADAQLDTFYVRDRPIDAEEHRRRYRAASSFAWRVLGGNGQKAFREKAKLAGDLERAPLETFSDVLRDSPFHITDDVKDAKYRPLWPKDADKQRIDAGVRGGWEYLRAYEALHEMAEDLTMEED